MILVFIEPVYDIYSVCRLYIYIGGGCHGSTSTAGQCFPNCGIEVYTGLILFLS